MNWIKRAREVRAVSQRNLAKRSGISFRTMQLLESGRWDPKISTLRRVVEALGYPAEIVEDRLRQITESDPDSVPIFTERLSREEDAWKIWLFNFVDRLRAKPEARLIDGPPSPSASERIRALTAATVESLCREIGRTPPDWCRGVPSLKEPWFPAEIENLKASALVESPIDFRKRNIFVLGNFLERA
jgi:transcriptional regulator with XRE-family HTH domain